MGGYASAGFPLLTLEDGDAAKILEASDGFVDPEDPELPGQPLGRDRDVDGFAAETNSIFDIHVVRPIDSGNRLAHSAVETMDDDRSRRSGDLHRPDNHALRWIGWMNPDGGIIRIIGQRRSPVSRLDLYGG